MRHSFVPRWKFTDSCSQPAPPGLVKAIVAVEPTEPPLADIPDVGAAAELIRLPSSQACYQEVKPV